MAVIAFECCRERLKGWLQLAQAPRGANDYLFCACSRYTDATRHVREDGIDLSVRNDNPVSFVPNSKLSAKRLQSQLLDKRGPHESIKLGSFHTDV